MSKKRVPCPFCKELILPKATKCRYCKEDLTKKKNLTIKSLYLLWILSMVLFIFFSFIMRKIDASTGSWFLFLGLQFLVVLAGVSFFSMLINRIIRNIRKKNIKKYGIATLITFFAFFAFLLNFNSIEAKLGITPVATTPRSNTTTKPSIPINNPTQKIEQKTQTQPTTSKTTISNQIDCTGPDGVIFKTTQEECDKFNFAWGNEPTPNPNEYIRCNIHSNCGGGFKEMTRASCERIICCQLNDTWELRDKDQCNTEQEQEANTKWVEFCNDLHNPDDCSIYLESGTTAWYECRSDAYSWRTDCYNNQ